MRIGLLGAGLIGNFYAMALQGGRGKDSIAVVYSRTLATAENFARQWDVQVATTDLEETIRHPSVDVVVVALPNHLHHQAVLACAKAGKPVLCTKPLGRNLQEATEMLQAVESSGVFSAYLEDLVYTPKTLKALKSVQNGAIGDVLWVRSRETHPGPHSDWFWNPEQAGGGAIVDMGCHCIEIGRNFIGKDIRPVEVMCWSDTQVHPIEVEDHAIGLVRYENGAVGQFEVSWTFRGGMDLRDEIAGTEGTIWLNHWLRTSIEMFSAVGESDYVAEKAESAQGWMFPVGNEPSALGYIDMFANVLNAFENGTEPSETFYDGYIVNAIMDSAYRSTTSKQWEPIDIPIWRGRQSSNRIAPQTDFDDEHVLVKRERMPDGTQKLILRHKKTGKISQQVR